MLFKLLVENKLILVSNIKSCIETYLQDCKQPVHNYSKGLSLKLTDLWGFTSISDNALWDTDLHQTQMRHHSLPGNDCANNIWYYNYFLEWIYLLPLVKTFTKENWLSVTTVAWVHFTLANWIVWMKPKHLPWQYCSLAFHSQSVTNPKPSTKSLSIQCIFLHFHFTT